MALAPIPGQPSQPTEAPAAPAEGTEGTEEFTLLPLGLGWEGSIFNGDPGRRFAWLLFVFLTYRLAFGRNDSGEYHVESGVNSAMDLYGRGYGYRQEPKQTRAVLKANVAGATVARRTNRKTSRRGMASGMASTERKLKASKKISGNRASSASREAAGEKTSTAEDQVAKQRAAKRGRDKAEARSALMNLGYSKTESNQMLAQAGDQTSPEAYIQAALRKRGKAV